MFVEVRRYATFWHLNFYYWKNGYELRISLKDPGQHSLEEYLGLLVPGISTALYFEDTDASLSVQDNVMCFQFGGFEHYVAVKNVESGLRVAMAEAQYFNLFPTFLDC